ncbi:MAG: hypothetical protein JWN48_1357 [Myxococcaceae bacterium]|nr:hypothetical protein [Myxococcaceae bacterium]
MLEVVVEFEKALDHERALALRADVDGLASIQEDKRALLDQLLASGAGEQETQRLREKALANVQLIRHLVACLQGLSAPAGPTYNAGGARPSGIPSRSWGRL